jgi:hypothetical protein
VALVGLTAVGVGGGNATGAEWCRAGAASEASGRNRLVHGPRRNRGGTEAPVSRPRPTRQIRSAGSCGASSASNQRTPTTLMRTRRPFVSSGLMAQTMLKQLVAQ